MIKTLLLVGLASWYQSGHTTASGERFHPNHLTAAHRSLPFGTRLRVENLRTHRAVIVRVNDRGPHIKGRVLDLSRGAARRIGMIGIDKVRIRRLG
jgi:rare lipoprotein A